MRPPREIPHGVGKIPRIRIWTGSFAQSIPGIYLDLLCLGLDLRERRNSAFEDGLPKDPHLRKPDSTHIVCPEWSVHRELQASDLADRYFSLRFGMLSNVSAILLRG